MIQFMKAMRDEKGEMVRNAHLLGFFRRICKLLFLRTKPVFVFDGGTPALKRRTVIARRRQRENAQAKIRKTAEKLLLNHLKAMKLKELAKDIQNQRKNNDVKGKKVLSDQTDMMENNSEKDDIVSNSYNQEQLDEMLAASLAAEEDDSFTGDASTSAAGIPSEEDDGDEDEEMILPTMHGKVDPAVLAALPPSMQLDLLVQMRERLMAENRQKYQKVKKAPSKFSELQIQSYLKTVAFRREIDEVQKSAAGRGVGGVQTSRIASEANREFIFSSSFTGDKQVLTSAGVERNGDKQSQKPSECPSGTLDSIASTITSSTATGSITDEPRRVIDDDVETYLDERGRVRMSRVRAMGIRMTRDLQRNLDMMKEIEQERTNSNKIVDFDSILNKNIPGVPRSYPNKNQIQENSPESNDETSSLNNRNEQSLSKNETSIEISFDDDSENKHLDGDDDLFARLVAGDPVIISSVDNTSSRKQSSDSASDFDWEEGIIEEKVDTHTNDVKAEIKPSFEGCISDGSEVEWEEGVHDFLKNASPCPADYGKVVSKGSLEEEADFQEAIRRSLEDLRGEKSIDASSEKGNIRRAGEMAHEGTIAGFLHQENDRSDPNLALKNVFQQNGSFHEIVSGVEKPDSMGGMNVSQTIDASGRHLISSAASNSNYMEVLIDKPREKCPGSHPDLLKQDANESGNLNQELLSTESVAPIETKANLSAEQLLDGSNEGDEVSILANSCPRNSSHISDSAFCDVPDAILADACKNDSEAAPTCHSNETIDHAVYKNDFEAACYSNETIYPTVYLGGASVKEATTDIDVEPKVAEEKDYDNFIMEREHNPDNSAIKDNKKVQVEVTEASLEEEILILGQECINLGEEQRKHERNAESVSSEMFAECQELLQMFGLPYIIAPMEAEAQCAYMELANLVDGVVTDDSDVFLFGARNVYKNIFDDRKYVETYFMKDIENELGLTREKLIRMAMLLGSDYTEGISGIGIVNAIEVVNAFPEEDGLHKFREWIESPDPTILGKFEVQSGSSSRKRGSKGSDNDTIRSKSNIEAVSASDPNVSQVHEHEQSMDYIQDIKQSFMHKHRTVSKNWHIPSSFPSEAVISAYASPEVDKSTEPFSWGKPDLFVLRKSCWEKFGWTSQKADELLLPVLKEYNKHETQLRLEAFYTFNERFAKIRSKRIKKAVKGITGTCSLELMDDAMQEVSKSRKKRRVSRSEPGSEKLSNGIENSVAGDESNSMEKLPSKQSRKRKIRGKPVPLEVDNLKPHMPAEGRLSTSKGSGGNRTGRGKGRGQQVGRGRRKGSPCLEFTESSSSDGNNGSNNEEEVCTEKLEEPPEVRRSTRSRKPVNYAVNDFEIDDAGNSLDQTDEERAGEEAVEQEPSWSQGTCGDAASGLIEKNQHKSGDALPEEGSCEDYLETGGGFCMDEEEIGELGTIKNVDPSFEAEFSKDYLKMGGGFCMEEGETDKDKDECAYNPASATVHENADPSHCSGSMDKDEHDIQPVQSAHILKRSSDGVQDGEKTDASDTGQNPQCLNATSNNVSKVVTSVQENTKGDSGPTSTRALSAMPFLRRKRRKS